MRGRFGMEEGTPLPRSIIEYHLKNRELGNPLITEEHITAFGWAAVPDLDDMVQLSLRINDFLSGLFTGIGLRLVDFKLEFGRIWDDEDEMQIILADEISPDSCRLWDIRTNRKLDKDRFRWDLGEVGRSLPGGGAASRRAAGGWPDGHQRPRHTAVSEGIFAADGPSAALVMARSRS